MGREAGTHSSGNSWSKEAENRGILSLPAVEAKRKAPEASPDHAPHPFTILFSGLGVWGGAGKDGEARVIIVGKAV